MRTAARAAMAVALLVCLVFMPRWSYGSDPLVVREEARAILLRGELHCDPNLTPAFSKPGQYFSQNQRNGLWYSKYGLFGAIASLPPLAVEYLTTGTLPPLDSPDRVYRLNIYNVLLATALAGLLLRLAANYTSRPRTAFAFAVSCLFCTFAWNYLRAQSSEIVQMLLGVGLADCLIRFSRTGKGRLLAIAWAAVTALALTRVFFVTLIPIAGVVTLLGRNRAWRWRIIVTLTGCAVVIGLLALVQFIKFGSPFLTGYEQWEPDRHKLTADVLPGLFGFLLDPQWSVWTHFPPMLIALPGWCLICRARGVVGGALRTEAVMIAAALLMELLLLSAIPSWAGEWCYGPRYLLFALPTAALPAVIAWDAVLGWGRRWPRRLVVGLCTLTLAVGLLMQMQMNRFEYFTFYYLRAPLMRITHDQPDAYPGRDYFAHRPYPLVMYDLQASGGQATALPFTAALRPQLSAAQWAEFKYNVKLVHHRQNYYWPDLYRRFKGIKEKPPKPDGD